MSKSVHLHLWVNLFCHTMRARSLIMYLRYFDQITSVITVRIWTVTSNALHKVRFWAWVILLTSRMKATILSWEFLINIRGRLRARPMNRFYLILVLRGWPYRGSLWSMLMICRDGKLATARAISTGSAALTLNSAAIISISETCSSSKVLHQNC